MDQMLGLKFAYNSLDSLSGYLIMTFYLQDRGYDPRNYFDWVKTGSHARSIDELLNGNVDGACIDYLVWRKMVEERKEILERLKIIDKLGPNPIQPLLLNIKKMSVLEVESIKNAFYNICENEELNRSLFKGYGFDRMIELCYRDDYLELDERINNYKKFIGELEMNGE